MTALGTVRLGSLASPPSAVALSKPTSEKMQATTAKPHATQADPLQGQLRVVDVEGRAWKSTTAANERIRATEAPSSTRVRMEETRMSL